MKEINDNYFDKSGKLKEKTIEDFLQYDEKILWRGKPKKTSYMLSATGSLLPFAILWAFFDFFVIIIMISTGEIGEMLFFIIPFFAIHLAPVWILIAKLIKASKEIENTSYAITNQRIISKRGLFGEQFYSTPFEEITGIEIKKDMIDKILHCGDIYISAEKVSFVLYDIHDSTFIYTKLTDLYKGISNKDREFYKNYSVCEHCGSYVNNTKKSCPNCGAKNEGFNPKLIEPKQK